MAILTEDEWEAFDYRSLVHAEEAGDDWDMLVILMEGDFPTLNDWEIENALDWIVREENPERWVGRVVH